MAILHLHELMDMDEEELNKNLRDLQEELMKINGVLASGGIPEDIGKVKEIKRTIARIKTIKNQKR
ncbi:MAG: 50S ribosomal protein L29 [Candidatus Altiarchaeales archaeon]|nr:MAG: 50S ribosomal protein L29 [Candidatus Altiarchaeales archaeon]